MSLFTMRNHMIAPLLTKITRRIVPMISGLVLVISPAFSQPLNPDQLWLRSHAAIIIDQDKQQILYSKHAEETLPIASLTKLMTAMVVLDDKQAMDEVIEITSGDKDRLRYSRSRLPVGTRLSRFDLLKIALMASENRAAAALARTATGGGTEFVRRMNIKARALGMQQTRFVDSTGLHQDNQASAHDVAKLVAAATQYPLISQFTSDGESSVALLKRQKELAFKNTNRLVRRANWNIQLSKTGYIKESGRCLTMQTHIAGRDLIVVLLNAQGRLSSFGDSGRIRRWLEQASSKQASAGQYRSG